MPKTPREERAKELIDALDQAGFDPRAYSGRAMFGKQCVSVSGEDVSLWRVARALPEDMNVSEPHIDSLGLGIVIYYWPYYEWPKDRETV